MWIKVIDLFPRPSQKDRDETTTASTSIGSNRSGKLAAPVIPDLIAHFRLPATQSYIPASHDSASANRPHPPSSSVAHLSFSPDGTHLFAAPKDGKAFHIFRLHPAGLLRDRLRGPCKGEAVHVYELRRGNTSASVCEVSWDSRGRWIGVGTGKGTIRMSPAIMFTS
jgi:WD40 repeat protein